MPLFVVYNPVCGDKKAKAFFEEGVLPLLEGRAVEKVVETNREGHAGEFVTGLVAEGDSLRDGEGIDVVLGSGDGTLHEIVNALFGAGFSVNGAAKVRLVLVPCGTANALYSSLYPPTPGPGEDVGAFVKSAEYRLRALRGFLEGKGGVKEVPLAFTVTKLLGAASLNSGGEAEVKKELVSTVVISTSLHAAILRDSEKLRDEYPGIERFKIAAQQNSDKWYNARVELLPLPGGEAAQIYDPQSHGFRTLTASGEGEGNKDVVTLQGPFTYFLSTVNVDRLEPAFNTTPLARSIPPPFGACDIVIVRPLRDPSISQDEPTARENFIPILWAILGAAYNAGAHVKLRYGDKGEVGLEGDGQLVVEYVRCGGWRWIPNEGDPDAHWVCSDGYVAEVEKGGAAECSVSTEGGNLVVYGSQ